MSACVCPQLRGAGTLTYDNDVTGDDGRGAGNRSAVIAAVARTIATEKPARAYSATRARDQLAKLIV